MNIPSKLIEAAVNELSKLPGVGKRMALRFVLHLLKKDEQTTENLANSLIKLKKEIQFCKVCYSLSDNELCSICSNPKRNQNLICVVEDIRDVMAVENTHQFLGLYHVLGSLISPIDGVGPDKLKIKELLYRIENNEVEEILFALPATVEGDTTGFYIFRQLQKFNIKITTLSKGISIGDQLEYADETTLGRSIVNRMLYEDSLVKT